MTRPRLIHCAYHKCLTVYCKRVMHALFSRCQPWSGGYRHYNSHLDDFYRDLGRFRVMSVNNRALDLDRVAGDGGFRISRFVRDPRDLVVSGYHYHKRGAEDWVRLAEPTDADWYFANAKIPDGLRARGGSYADYLQSLDEEGGLLAELELRQHHFESMMQWPRPGEHPHILVQRYEDILQDQVGAFRRIFSFYGLGAVSRAIGTFFARRYSSGSARQQADPHVRDPASGQWRRHFTPRLCAEFEARHPGLVEALGYPAA